MDKLTALVSKIRADGGEAVAFPLDITEPESVKAFVTQTIDAIGEIELLVSGAGDVFPGRIHEISTDAFLAQIQVHLIGANRLATAVLPDMVARKQGTIVVISSVLGLMSVKHRAGYSASKHALHGYFR